MSTQTLQPAFVTFRPSSFRGSRSPALHSSGPLRILTTLAEVDRIAEDWRALEGDAPETNGFQSFDWCRAWMHANGPDSDDCWRIVTLREKGRLVGLWPLQREFVFGARVLRWLGEPWTQYGDVLAMPGPDRMRQLGLVWDEIRTWRDVDLLKLGRLRAGSIAAALPALDPLEAVHCEGAPFVDLLRSGKNALKSKRLRARRRKLEEMGAVRFEIVTDPAFRRACVRDAIALKRAWLDARNLTSTGMWHRGLDMLMDELASSETLVIGRLAVGEETAALELGLHGNGAFRSLLGCHDPKFANGSPGHLLIGHMIEWCVASGCRTYDLMLPADTYKSQWANDCVSVADHAVPMNWRGSLIASAYRMRPALKAAYHRLPQSIRRLPAVVSPNS